MQLLSPRASARMPQLQALPHRIGEVMEVGSGQSHASHPACTLHASRGESC